MRLSLELVGVIDRTLQYCVIDDEFAFMSTGNRRLTFPPYNRTAATVDAKMLWGISFLLGRVSSLLSSLVFGGSGDPRSCDRLGCAREAV